MPSPSPLASVLRPALGQAKRTARRAGITRARLAAARMCCERTLASRAWSDGATRSRILCYHSVGTPEWGVNDVAPARFRRQLELALEGGWRFVPAEQIASGAAPGGSLAVTFDDGLTSVLTHAAPILRDLGIPWTVFVVAAWSDGDHGFGDGLILSWRQVEAAAAAGGTVGSHSYSHPNFATIPPDRADDELARSREVIAARTGIVTRDFAIPFGQSRDWTAAAHDAANRAGYRHVYAQAEDTRPGGTVARTFVTRFDGDRVFRAALHGAFDRWEEWR